MTDEWEFRTARGRGSVANGALRVENSLVVMARNRWVGQETKSRVLFLFTTFTTILGFHRVVDAGRALFDGSAAPWQVLMLAAGAFVVLALLRRALRTKAVPLRRIQSVRRVDDECVRVVYTEGDDIADFEIETPTEADADEAVEILRLKGVRVGDGSDADETESKSITFRERLAKKVE